jgi:hypothetical protein
MIDGFGNGYKLYQIYKKGCDLKMVDIKAEDIKETYETQSQDESAKYQGAGWILIDTYKVDGKEFFVLAWIKDGASVRP